MNPALGLNANTNVFLSISDEFFSELRTLTKQYEKKKKKAASQIM